MLLRVTEGASGLTLAYPAWLGLIILAMGVALTWHLFRRFTASGKTFGIVMAAALCLFGGVHFLAYKVTLTVEGARVYAPLRVDASLRWPDVTQVSFEERPSGRGGRQTHLVLRGDGGELDFAVSPLSAQDRVRVTDFVERQVAGNKRTPG